MLNVKDIKIEDDDTTLDVSKPRKVSKNSSMTFHTAGSEINDVDLDRLFNFTVPTQAREPREVAIDVESEIIFNLKNKYYDVIMILTGASDNILNLNEIEINEFRSKYNYAKLNFSEALGLYSYFIETFGKDKFYIKDDGYLTLKLTFDDYSTKVKDKIETIDFSLKLDLYIINLLYNIRLNFEKKVAKKQILKAEENFYAQHSANDVRNYLEFDEDPYTMEMHEDMVANLYVDDNDELGGSSIQQAKKAKLLKSTNKEIINALINKNISYKKASYILDNVGFSETKKGSILKEYNYYLSSVKHDKQSKFLDFGNITKDVKYSDIEF